MATADATPRTASTGSKDMTASASDLADEGAEIARATAVSGMTKVEASRAVLGWARERFAGDLVALSSMADEVMVHLASHVVPGIEVVFIDTGEHFPETLRTRDDMAATLDIRIVNVTPSLSADQQAERHGPRLFERDPDLCCRLRKVEPLNRALADRRAWVTGLRRADGPTRSGVALVELDAKRDMVKINPLADWGDEDVARYVSENRVIQHPLRALGYTSIGCSPCTDRPSGDADPRSGRWPGQDKTECGLHR